MKLFTASVTFVLALFFGALLTLRLFPAELCLIGVNIGQCEQRATEAESFEVATLLQQIQDGLRRVQKTNDARSEPHMLFIDDLELDIQFVAKQSAGGKFQLVVVPFGGEASSENSEIQKMHLTFSTVLDERTQSFIKEACESESLFRSDLRVGTFCPPAVVAAALVEPAEVSINSEGLGIDVESFTSDYNLSAQAKTAIETVCQSGDCGEVTRFSVDPLTKTVQDLVIAPAPGQVVAAPSAVLRAEDWGSRALEGGKILLEPSAID